jgi:nickel/cobalt transporter (NicO) family protein
MWQIITGSFILSMIHAAIPNHWLPLVALGKTEKWSHRETLRATALIGLAHISSTILIGILVGFAGFKLSVQYEHISHWMAPLVLSILGLIYIFLSIAHKGHHHHEHFKIDNQKQRSKAAIIATMAFAMFFSPCLELEVYYFQAGLLGWKGIITASIIYTVMTVSLMVLLVHLGRKGIDRLNWHFLEHNEKLIAGIVLIALALLAFFVEF